MMRGLTLLLLMLFACWALPSPRLAVLANPLLPAGEGREARGPSTFSLSDEMGPGHHFEGSSIGDFKIAMETAAQDRVDFILWTLLWIVVILPIAALVLTLLVSFQDSRNRQTGADLRQHEAALQTSPLWQIQLFPF